MLALPLWVAAWTALLHVPAVEGPQARFSVDRFDFGKVMAGTSPSGELSIENVGDAPLAIKRIGVTCECAKLQLSTPTRLNVPIDPADEGRVDLTLAAGGKATLKITVDTSKLAAGLFEKRLLIVCTDPKNGALSLPFKVEVEKPAPPAKPAEGDTMGAARPPADGAGAHPAGRDAAPVDPALAPKLEVDSWAVDFGTVFRGEKLRKSFQLKNVGKSDLVINEIRNSCSCAASKLTIDGHVIEEQELKESKRLGVLSPGEEATLEVELKTATATTPGKEAELNKPVRIHTNDPATPVATVTLTATMISPFTVEPPRIDFGVVRKGAGAKRSAIVWSDQLGDFLVTGATSPNPELLKVSVSRVETEAGKPPTWRIDAEVSAAAALGAFASHVELQVAHDRVKEIVIPIGLSVEPNVQFIDNRPDTVELLDFGVMTAGEGKSIELTVENGDAAIPYVLHGAAIGTCRPSSEGFAVETVEVEKGMKYRVKITAPAELGKATYFQGDIVLTADHPDGPLKKLRIRGWYPSQAKGESGDKGPR